MARAASAGAAGTKHTKGARLDAVATWADERTGLAAVSKKLVRKVFPDHWSFMLGEIALWSFVVLLVTGTLLTLWFKPSMAEVVYDGSYDELRGLHMSEAYASTLDISFDVRGGLLLRQMHHWAAMLFIAGMFVHMIRVFLTGAFRKPRELNWITGFTLLILGVLEGFAGYSLPDDLLSGTGLRIADGLIKSIPVVGTYVSFFAFDGEFPGGAIIPRLFIAHVLLIPGILLALVGLHLVLLVYHKHTQWPGPGRADDNVVGYPFLPVYAAKTGGFFFIVFGVTALMGGLLSLNPVWKYGPYNPAEVTAGSQPDWYMGFVEGLLRIVPGWESELFGYTISWNVLIPGVVAPSLMIMVFMLYPFIEAWITGDKRDTALIQRPRNAPTRTAFLVAMMTLYGVLWAAGGNDVLAVVLDLNLNYITYFVRVMAFVGPVIAFIVARRWCISLQRADEARLLHGYETGIIVRAAEGAYAEKHLPLTNDEAYVLTARERDPLLPDPTGTDADDAGVRQLRRDRLRARLSHAWFGHNVQKPTAAQLEEARRHSEHELALLTHGPHQLGGDHTDEYEPGGLPADGHQFDGRHPVAGEELR